MVSCNAVVCYSRAREGIVNLARGCHLLELIGMTGCALVEDNALQVSAALRRCGEMRSTRPTWF